MAYTFVMNVTTKLPVMSGSISRTTITLVYMVAVNAVVVVVARNSDLNLNSY